MTEDVVEDYVVNVEVPTTKEVQVQVCKMVPKLVLYTFNPCCGSGYSTGGGTMGGSASGCGCGAVAAPVSNCGCAR